MMTSHNLPIPYYCTNLSSQLYECKSTAECGNIHCNDVTATHETTRRAVASAQHDGPSRWLVWYDDRCQQLSNLSVNRCIEQPTLNVKYRFTPAHTHTQMDKQTYRKMYTHTHTHRWTNRHTERCTHTHTHTDGQTDIQRDVHTHTHTRTDSGMWERQLRIIMFAEWHNVSSRHQGMFHKYR